MGQPSIWDRLREWIGGIGFDVFLWANHMTADQYLTEVEGRAIDAYIGPWEPPTRYWMHEEEGRVCECKTQPSARWYQISPEQYKYYDLHPLR